MIQPTPGADPASRIFGYAMPPDGAGLIGPDGLWPQPIDVPFSEVLKSLNPLQHVPVVGTIYRAVTGETIPAPLRILGAGIFGGPIGILGAAVMSFVGALFAMGPDLSRPSVPAGMSATGSEAPMGNITPGTLKPGEYTTLATTVPEFLQSPTQFASSAPPQVAGGASPPFASGASPPLASGASQRGFKAYYDASQEWQRAQAVEKGLA